MRNASTIIIIIIIIISSINFVEDMEIWYLWLITNTNIGNFKSFSTEDLLLSPREMLYVDTHNI